MVLCTSQSNKNEKFDQKNDKQYPVYQLITGQQGNILVNTEKGSLYPY